MCVCVCVCVRAHVDIWLLFQHLRKRLHLLNCTIFASMLKNSRLYLCGSIFGLCMLFYRSINIFISFHYTNLSGSTPYKVLSSHMKSDRAFLVCGDLPTHVVIQRPKLLPSHGSNLLQDQVSYPSSRRWEKRMEACGKTS